MRAILLITLLVVAVVSSSPDCGGFRFNASVALLDGTDCTLRTTVWDVKAISTSNKTSFLCYDSISVSMNATSNCGYSEVCNGDAEYCKSHSCNSNSPYYCRNQEFTSNKVGDCGFGWITYTLTSTKELCFPIWTYKPPSKDNYFSASDVISIFSSPDLVTIKVRKTASFSYVKFLIVDQVYLSNTRRRIVVFNSDSIKRSAEDYSIPISTSTVNIYAMSDDRYLSVFSRSYHKSSFNLTADELCATGRCDFCESKAQFAMCKIGSFGYINTAAAVVVVLVVLCLLPWIIAFFTLIWKLVRCCFRPLIMCCSKAKNITVSEEMSSLTSDDVPINLDEEIAKGPKKASDLLERSKKIIRTKGLKKKVSISVDGSSENTRVKSLKPATQGVMMLALFVLFFSPNVFAACTSNIISSSDIFSCTRYNSSHSQCQINPISTFGLTGVGDKVCITIIANGSSPVGTIEVSFESLVASSPLSTQYYTSCWVPITESSKSCWLEGCCTWDSYTSCRSWMASGDQNPCGKFSVGISSIPGKTGCNSYPGCVSNGCFMCDATCNYYRYGLLPRGSIIRVASTGHYIQYTASLSMTTSFSSDVYRVTTQSSSFSDPTNTFSLLLQGMFIDFGVTLPKPIAIREGVVKFVDAAPVNAPVYDNIGDIQSPSPDMLSAGVNSFRFSDSLITPQVQSWGTSFENKGCGAIFFDSTVYPSLPTHQSGFLWSYVPSSDQIQADITRSLTAIATLTFKKPFSFQFLDEAICPQIESAAASGCYSCDEGAIISVTAKSTCFPGVCTIVVPPEYVASSNTLYLSNSNEVTNFTVFSGFAENSMNLTLICKDMKASYSFDFGLLPKSRTNNATNTTYSNPPGGDKFRGLELDGIFFGLDAKWKSDFLIAGIVIGSIVFLIIILIIILKYAPCKFCQRPSNEVFKDIMGITAIKSIAQSDKFQYSKVPSNPQPESASGN